MLVRSTDLGSCLVRHVSTYLRLSDGELARLIDLQRDRQRIAASTRVQTRGRPARHFYVVKSGWLFSSVDSPDGKRHIQQFHQPGDVIGMQNAPFEAATCHVDTIDACVLAPVPRRRFGELLDHQPRLAAVFVAISARDEMVAFDMKLAIGQFRAGKRVLLLFLILLHRMRVTDGHLGTVFEVPINQSHIGDIVGLTNVSVSKCMTALEREGWIARRSRAITLPRLAEAKTWLEFEDRYATIDTSWFPRAEQPASISGGPVQGRQCPRYDLV